ncbi:amyloid-beta A4 precursor protein-binding family B member 3 isoform X3 [Nerophis lumbriciformis]|uniref:amyloid-beta A4 precursor protein-binding family B member 3 isoform X3 n=1 Tax=Nerophis lumbriciformis TaxID=546530 RepID=UPI002ADF3FD3|nr:amyloid-beta A4 precursor protein-binding family B member 3-like isoform X3 [Nerophis lumbriciformis]
MMGKDYMLAIIIVNCDDNIWTDQNLLLDQDLPSDWRTIKDSTGTYYWHVPTGTTQWQHPRLNGAPQQPAPPPEQQKDQNGSSNCSADADRAHGAHRFWWSDESCSHDDNSQCFSVRSLGWLQVEEDDLSPGRSSLVVSDVIQQLSRCGGDEQRDRLGSSGEGRDMMLVLKRDTLTLVDALDHAPLYCQPIVNIRVWGVGSNNGRDRDFAFVAGDKDSCVLKCHVFRCDAPAKAVAMALHQMCSKMMSGQKATRSLTMESIVPEDLPGQVDFLEAVRQQVQKFDVRYVGSLPVSRAMGMEVLNSAIESIMDATEHDQWEASIIHVTDNILYRALVTGRGGAVLGVPGASSQLPRRGPGQSHLRRDRRWRHPALRVPRVLVRAGRGAPVRGGPGGVHGSLPEVFGGSDSAPQDQAVARNPAQDQTGQLHGRRRFPASRLAPPRQGERRREAEHDGLF